VTNQQKRLQGHCNQITAIACSNNKRWVVTADSGDDSMLIAWDSYSGIPVRMFLNPHPNGISHMALSADDLYIATLGADEPQTVSIWDWTDETKDGPIVSLQCQISEF
jgi:cilia- and flagella-associated protein 251